MVKISAKMLLLLGLSVFVAACLPGEKRAANRNKIMTQTSVEAVTALSMSQTLENEAARIQAMVQEIFNEGGVTSEDAYNALITGGGFTPTKSELVGVGLCPGNTGMFAYLRTNKINGLGNLSDNAPAEKIRKSLVERYDSNSVGMYKGGEVVGVPTFCETAVAASGGDIADNSPVVVLNAPIIADDKKTHVYSNYEYVVGEGTAGLAGCPAGYTGQKIYRREVVHLDVADEEKPVEQSAWDLISDTCAEPKIEKEAIIDWSLSDQGNVDWLKKLSEPPSIDPRKMVLCDSNGNCEQIAPDDAEKRIVECGPPQNGDKPAMDPMIAVNLTEVSEATGCSYVSALADGPDGEKRYSLSGCTVPETNNCTAYEIAKGVIALEGDQCATSCGKGWYGNISSNYQYRACTVNEVDQDGNITEVEAARSIYNYYNTSVDCTKDNYRAADLTCNMTNAAATSGKMEVKLEGEIHVKLDDNGNLPTPLRQAKTAEEFDQAAIDGGYATDTGAITGCNANANTCKSLSNIDFLVVLVDRSSSMSWSIPPYAMSQTYGQCRGKIENIFEQNKVQDMCENLEFKLAVDKLVDAADNAYWRMSYMEHMTCDDSGTMQNMSMTDNPAEVARNYNPAVFYTGDNYNPRWGYQQAYAESDSCKVEIKSAIDGVNAQLKLVYDAYKKYAAHIPQKSIENLVGTREMEYYDFDNNTGVYSGGIPDTVNPDAWKAYFEALRNRAQAISDSERLWLQQGLRERIKDQCIVRNADGSIKSSCIDSIRKSCSDPMTDGLIGTCYPPSAFGLPNAESDKVSCQPSCLGSCSFPTTSVSINNRNDIVNRLLKNTIIRYAPADKDTGYAIPVLVTDFWGSGMSHSIFGFNANGDMQSVVSSTTGLDEYGLMALNDPRATDNILKGTVDTSHVRFNTYLRKYSQYDWTGWWLKPDIKNVGPGCLDDEGWAFVKAQKDSGGTPYYSFDSQMIAAGWRHCPTTREEFMQFIEDNPMEAYGNTNLYLAVENSMLWANRFSRSANLVGPTTAAGFRKNMTKGRLIIFSDGKDTSGGSKLIGELALKSSDQDKYDSGTSTSVNPNTIEGFILTYYPNFSIDLMALDGGADIKSDMVLDKDNKERVTNTTDVDGTPITTPWSYVKLQNDTDEADYMQSIDTSSAVGFQPDIMCDVLYNIEGEVAGMHVKKPDISVQDFLYGAELGENNGSVAQCLTSVYYRSYSLNGSGILLDDYIPCPYGLSCTIPIPGTTTPSPTTPSPTTPAPVELQESAI